MRPWLDVRPSERITRGNYAKIPVVMGSVDDEGTRFIRPDIAEGENEFLEVVKGSSSGWTRAAPSSQLLLPLMHLLTQTDIFDFTYGAVEELLEPILAYYPPDPKVGSPFFTGPETFGLSSNYKRLSSFVGDILFQAPRRHFLRETPKDFGEDSWNYLYREPRAGAQARMGSTSLLLLLDAIPPLGLTSASPASQTVQHGADLPAWFGHPDESDEPMLELSWDMTGYLMSVAISLCGRCCNSLVADLSRFEPCAATLSTSWIPTDRVVRQKAPFAPLFPPACRRADPFLHRFASSPLAKVRHGPADAAVPAGQHDRHRGQ